jgi:hypothetical protein
MRERAILQAYLTVWGQERANWEGAGGIGKGSVRAHEEKLFFLRDIADSLRTLAERDPLDMSDLHLNFDE